MLAAWDLNDLEVRARLVSLVYPELRQIAENRMSRERRDHTLQPTALVSEFFLNLMTQEDITWQGRSHFLAVASNSMRHLLVDYARSHNADKRGGGMLKVQLECIDVHVGGVTVDALEFDQLLDQLAEQEPRMVQVVELRCFGGLTHDEIGEVLKIDGRTAKRDWKFAKAWLRSRIGDDRASVERRVDPA